MYDNCKNNIVIVKLLHTNWILIEYRRCDAIIQFLFRKTGRRNSSIILRRTESVNVILTGFFFCGRCCFIILIFDRILIYRCAASFRVWIFISSARVVISLIGWRIYLQALFVYIRSSCTIYNCDICLLLW